MCFSFVHCMFPTCKCCWPFECLYRNEFSRESHSHKWSIQHKFCTTYQKWFSSIPLTCNEINSTYIQAAQKLSTLYQFYQKNGQGRLSECCHAQSSTRFFSDFASIFSTSEEMFISFISNGIKKASCRQLSSTFNACHSFSLSYFYQKKSAGWSIVQLQTMR